MLCDQCGEREAVVDLTQIANDDVKKMHLCERCAAERGVESPVPANKTPLGTFLAAMSKGGAGGGLVEAQRCPGATISPLVPRHIEQPA